MENFLTLANKKRTNEGTRKTKFRVEKRKKKPINLKFNHEKGNTFDRILKGAKISRKKSWINRRAASVSRNQQLFSSKSPRLPDLPSEIGFQPGILRVIEQHFAGQRRTRANRVNVAEFRPSPAKLDDNVSRGVPPIIIRPLLDVSLK